ncbi:MAG TPA: NIPSNAP family protein [bacterium]|nr:NIPSNAP family protein [bacterium]
MIYELRVYRCMPGRKADVLARFRDHTMGFFRKHGIHVSGFWETAVGDQDDLIYITRYDSWEDREKKWGAFQADPDWQRVRNETHARGWIVEHIKTALLTATDFSPVV